MRKYLIQYITSHVRHAFDSKLENLRSEFKREYQQQEHLHDTLKQAIKPINGELEKRKILAIDQLWESFLAMKRLNLVAKALGTLNFEEIRRRVDDSRIQEFLSFFRAS